MIKQDRTRKDKTKQDKEGQGIKKNKGRLGNPVRSKEPASWKAHHMATNWTLF